MCTTFIVIAIQYIFYTTALLPHNHSYLWQRTRRTEKVKMVKEKKEWDVQRKKKREEMNEKWKQQKNVLSLYFLPKNFYDKTATASAAVIEVSCRLCCTYIDTTWKKCVCVMLCSQNNDYIVLYVSVLRNESTSVDIFLMHELPCGNYPFYPVKHQFIW